MKSGIKLKSTVCDTEVMVIRCGEGVIACGGAPLSEEKHPEIVIINEKFCSGTLIGKRYIDEGGLFELLCVKSGIGSLSIDGTILKTKDAKPLPSSD